ncbi:hypothetical protein [Streptomyces mutabilis]|uniref:Uncharacterized protein n=1 Tax=Streptomyces mutabilis TaxID=67332 RepID=A0A086MV99_9ACTN|nr:hypothetical protein [Streptomyces mutabilis]KFG72817.1 hypothetical protein FM21_18245 [Streptomyces mutabilis]
MTVAANSRRAATWNDPVGARPVRHYAMPADAGEMQAVTVAPVTAGAARVRVLPDAAELLLSPLPGGALPASRLAGPEELLLPFATGSGARRARADG